MPVTIEHLRQLVKAEIANEWIDPESVQGIDKIVIQKLNYDHGRLLGSQADLDYLEESGDRLIVSYIDLFLNNNTHSVKNSTLQSARLWLILNYWSVGASYPVIGWIHGLKVQELELIIKKLLTARDNCNPFVDDLICSFTRELLLSFFETGSELEDLLSTLPVECAEFVQYIKIGYIQDGYAFSNISFEEMKSRC